jgi:CheY-like chemotaxis protein
MSSTVLYIEDNATNVRLVERLLMRRPHTTLHVATNAEDGIKAANDDQPDLVLLDNGLPDATGSEVLRQLASSPATAAIPVVILTGELDPTITDELLTIGASELLTKPFDIHEFLAMVDRYIR